VVDPSLLRQASDRGVTIAFADLDGAEGLWVPEERTVLVNRALPESRISEVIEHELAHVMIDDQHADLDAGREVLAGRPPAPSRRLLMGLAAAGLVAVVGGVTVGMKSTGGGADEHVVAPTRGVLTPSEPNREPAPPGSTVIRIRNAKGEIVYITITPGAPVPPTPTPSPTLSATPNPTASAPVPPPPKTKAPAPPAQPTASPTPPPSTVADVPPVIISPTPDPTTPDPPAETSPAAGASEPAGAAATDGGLSSGDAPAPGTGDPSDVLVAASAAAVPVADPTG
jgi:outer membrane biosynthesis protein TonB